MKLPWKRRAEQAHARRLAAEERLHDVQADWPKVDAETAIAHRERDLNGWTATVLTLFSGRAH